MTALQHRAVTVPAAFAAALLLSACHGGGRPVSQMNELHIAHNYMTDHLMTVNMGALGNSKQWGTASMGDRKHGLDVAVTLQNAPKRSETAYVGEGNCTQPPTTVWKPLQPVFAGKSKSHIDGVTVGDIKKGRYAVVVDRAGSKKPVSCGDFEL